MYPLITFNTSRCIKASRGFDEDAFGDEEESTGGSGEAAVGHDAEVGLGLTDLAAFSLRSFSKRLQRAERISMVSV